MKYTYQEADVYEVIQQDFLQKLLIQNQKVLSFWELFPTTTKNWHNRMTVLYTKY